MFELHACRFCGSDQIEEFEGDDEQVTAIYCIDCPAGLEDNYVTLDELRVIWNGPVPTQYISRKRNDTNK